MAPGGDDPVSLGEVNRNVEKLNETLKDTLTEIRNTTVHREVYEIDRKNTNGRFDRIEEGLSSSAKKRLQIWLALLVCFIGSGTSIVIALIEVRGHP
jgi:hypothetical protein